MATNRVFTLGLCALGWMAVALAADKLPQEMQPGLWELTSGVDTPNAPPEPSKTGRHCIKAADLPPVDPVAMARMNSDGPCNAEKVKKAPGHYSADYVCPKQKLSSHFEENVSATSVDFKKVMETTDVAETFS